MTDRPFRVLVVCTGNICRSPMGERLLAVGMQRRFGGEAEQVSVTSAGTWGRDGAPMEPYAEKALVELGADPTGFAARELSADLVREADLVLGATRDHRAAVVTMVPRASAYTFTLPEFARLAAAADPRSIEAAGLADAFSALVRAAAAQRGIVRPRAPQDDDIRDPYGASPEVFQACAAAVAAPVDAILDVVRAVWPGP